MDRIFGLEPGRNMRVLTAIGESNRRRPIRILNWLKKLVDVVPDDLLIVFLNNCLELGPEETIKLFEVKKGEASSRDYDGEPTGFNLDSLRHPPL